MKQLLNDSIEDYLRLRRSQDYSKNTLRQDEMILRRFLTVNGNIYTHNVGERHVLRHFEESAKTRSATTLSLDHAVLNKFFAWARTSSRMNRDNDPMAGRRMPRRQVRERERIPVSKFPALLDSTEDPRDRCMVALFLYTLCRDQEVADLRIGDVDLDGGWLQVRITKSRMEDRMPICEELDAELRGWLTHYSTLHPVTPYMYLLPRRSVQGSTRGHRGRFVKNEMAYEPHEKMYRPGEIVHQLLAEGGFLARGVKGEGSHTLRRSGARALFDRLAEGGYDHSLRIVQSMLHHASVAQTEKYIGITADRRSRDEILRGKPMYTPGLARVEKISRVGV